MLLYCDACTGSLHDEALAVQLQEGVITRMADGTARLSGRAPRQHVLCRDCGAELRGWIDWMLTDDERKQRPSAQAG